MQKLQKRKSEGFTIIETLIVLAIVGVIMVIVFLAVPALNRSSRNNALSTDVNNLLSGISEYSNNNGGRLPSSFNPDAFTAGSGTVTLDDNAITGENELTVKLGGTLQALSWGTGTTTTITTTSNVGDAQIITGTGAVCNATNTGLVGTTSGSTRSVAIVYAAEGSSGTTRVVKCVSS